MSDPIDLTRFTTETLNDYRLELAEQLAGIVDQMAELNAQLGETQAARRRVLNLIAERRAKGEA